MGYNYRVFRSYGNKRKLVRIPSDIMNDIGIEIGDYVSIKNDANEKETIALAVLSKYKDILYIDQTISLSLGLSGNETLSLSPPKREIVNDGVIHIYPIDNKIPISKDGFIRAIKLEYRFSPLIDGDILYISTPNHKYKFMVRIPSDNIIVLSDHVEVRLKNIDLSQSFSYMDLDRIGGLHDVKNLIQTRIILPLEHPEIFEKFKKNIKPPSGVLLYGPPGTGKTITMKAIAGKLKHCTFIQISASEIYNKYYGESERRIEEIFKEARENAPSILFIDEFDAIASKRNEHNGEMETRIIGKFLTEMDGLKSNDNVIVIASTNRPNSIDEAFRRSGRFDYEIEFPIPNKSDRLEILKIHTSDIPMEKDVDLKILAEKTHGYVGADLYGLVMEAVMQCITRNVQNFDLSKPVPKRLLNTLRVSMEDFEEALKLVRPSVMRSYETDISDVEKIIGMEEIKNYIEEIITWRVDPPSRLSDLGFSIPSNIFLYGPPGCGKTSLIKYIAKEVGYNFFYVKSPEVMTKWLGESPRNISNIFSKATQSQPSIIFIDEIDAISMRRNYIMNDAVIRVISQLLLEIDALKSKQVTVIAATNNPNMVEPALLRSGRFDIHLYIPPPSEEERRKIFSHFLSDLPTDDVDIDRLAKATEGFSVSDIKSCIKFTVYNLIRIDKEKITTEDLLKSISGIHPSINKEMIQMYESFKSDPIPRNTYDLYS